MWAWEALEADIALEEVLLGVGEGSLKSVRFFRVVLEFVPSGAGELAATAANVVDLENFDACLEGAGEVFQRRTRLDSSLFPCGLMC